MSYPKLYVTLGDTALEITPTSTSGNATELLPKNRIASVTPVTFQERGADNTDWPYMYDTITVIRIYMKGVRELRYVDIELQNVQNQSGWNGGTLADLQQAVSDITAWLPSGGATVPVISVSPLSRTFSDQFINTYSASQTISVSGSNLVDDITITAPSGFIVNLDNSNTNASPLVLSESGGSVSSTTVYIKYHPTTTGSSSGGVALTSSGAVPKNVSVSGNCPIPNLIIDPYSFLFGDMSVNDYTPAQTFTIEGTWLQSNVVITAPSGFIINQDGSDTNASPITLTPTSGTLSSETIYIKFHPLTSGNFNQNISVATTGISDQYINVNGDGIPPYVTSDATAVTNLNYTQPGPSASSPLFSVEGYGLNPYLSGNLTLTCSTNLQVSSDGTTWSSSLSVPYTNGTVVSAEIYRVRLKAGLSTGAYNETLTISGGGATPYVIPCTGNVIGVPDIVVSPSTLSFPDTAENTNSAQQTFTVSGSWLLDDITITPPTGFKISLTNGSGYASTPIVLNETGGTVASTTIYAVFSPTAVAPYSGDIACTSSGATTENVAVDGDGISAFDPDAQTIINNMIAAGSTPTAPFQEVINRAVKNLKGTGTQGSANIWALLDCLQMFSTLTEIQSLVAWKGNNPTKYNSPTYVAKSGWLPASVGSHSLWSNFTPSVNGVNYTQNNCSFGVWLGANPGTSYFMGSLGTHKSAVRTVATNNDNYCNSSSFALANFSTMTEGLFWINRASSSVFKTIKNATVISSPSSASSGLPSWNMAVAGYANAATTIAAIPSLTNPVKIAFAGAGLEAHATQLYNTFNQYISEVAAL